MHSNLWIEVEKWLWTSQVWPAGGLGARPPPARGLAGATVAVLNTYKKNFLKKF